MGILRYPGGKTRFLNQILPHLVQDAPATFADLFVGGGSVLLAVAKALPHAKLLINDIDDDVAAFWNVVVTDVQALQSRVDGVVPTTAEFRQHLDARKEDKSLGEVERAYRLLFLSRCSFSGAMKNPLGGWDQRGRWKIDYTWNPQRICARLEAAADLLRGRTQVTCRDILDASWAERVYLDPPYWRVGKWFYRVDMSPEHHAAMAEMLKARADWVLSYNDLPEVRKLYSWATIRELNKTYYSITGPAAHRRTAQRAQLPELIILP